MGALYRGAVSRCCWQSRTCRRPPPAIVVGSSGVYQHPFGERLEPRRLECRRSGRRFPVDSGSNGRSAILLRLRGAVRLDLQRGHDERAFGSGPVLARIPVCVRRLRRHYDRHSLPHGPVGRLSYGTVLPCGLRLRCCGLGRAASGLQPPVLLLRGDLCRLCAHVGCDVVAGLECGVHAPCAAAPRCGTCVRPPVHRAALRFRCG